MFRGIVTGAVVPQPPVLRLGSWRRLREGVGSSDGAGNDTPEHEAWDSNAAAADRESPAATRRGLPETTTTSKRHPARQKSENDQTRCSVDGVVRPQSSPHDARVSADHGGSEGFVARYATSTPPCMQSRLFLQSAMDRSLSSRGWGGSGSRAASPENCPNKHLASSLPDRGTEEGETLPINTVSYTHLTLPTICSV